MRAVNIHFFLKYEYNFVDGKFDKYHHLWYNSKRVVHYASHKHYLKMGLKIHQLYEWHFVYLLLLPKLGWVYNLKFKDDCNGIQFLLLLLRHEIQKSACREWLCGINDYIYENMVAKANKNRLVVSRKTSSVLSYKVWSAD